MNPTVSIIVPVYNAETSLKRCVDSILNQTFTDFELLLANDGSKDSSGAICDAYATADRRVHVLHKENTGVSDTRNQAIALAQGEFLQFIDSDDWLTPDATRLMVRAAREENCDLVITDFYRVVGERLAHKGDIREEGILTREEFAARMMKNPADFYYGVLWNKLFRRDIIESHQLRMDPHISWCEDFMFNLEYILRTERIYVLRVPIYYYVKTRGSLATQGMSLTRTIRMKLMIFEYYNSFYKHIFDEEDYEKMRPRIYRFLVDAAGDGSVLPPIISDSRRLGEERTGVSADAICGEDPLVNLYLEQKLFDYYLETAALKYTLTIKDMRLLFYVMEHDEPCTRRELADITGMTTQSLLSSLQKLQGKDLITVTELKTREQTLTEGKFQIVKRIQIALTEAAARIQEELLIAAQDYENARYEGFTEEERIQYDAFHERIKNNIQQILL